MTSDLGISAYPPLCLDMLALCICYRLVHTDDTLHECGVPMTDGSGNGCGGSWLRKKNGGAIVVSLPRQLVPVPKSETDHSP